MDLNTIWFGLLFVLLAVYAVLDGFDLGVGVLHLFARNENERRVGLAAIGPVWDGNEVWLITAGAVMFAAFPPVYAAIFSGFYIALMLLLLALITRAVSLEFRSKVESIGWQRTWDIAFGVSSLLIALLLSVALGNLLLGVPIDEHGEYAGTFLGLLNPYAILVGVTGVVLVVMHGAAYMAVKSEGDLQLRSRRLVGRLLPGFAVLYVACLGYSYQAAGQLYAGWVEKPLIWVMLAVLLLAVVGIVVFAMKRLDLQMFFATSVTVFAVMAVCGLAMFPNLAMSTVDRAYSLTAENASSSAYTLKVLLAIICIGLPFVIAYTAGVYWIFRGKVKVSAEGY